jgi:hypothetical protein
MPELSELGLGRVKNAFYTARVNLSHRSRTAPGSV